MCTYLYVHMDTCIYVTSFVADEFAVHRDNTEFVRGKVLAQPLGLVYKRRPIHIHAGNGDIKQ